MFEPAPPKMLNEMTPVELQEALKAVNDKITNNDRGVAPPHLKRGTTARLKDEKDRIEAEIQSREPGAANSLQ